jgi:hypothetical protein
MSGIWFSERGRAILVLTKATDRLNAKKMKGADMGWDLFWGKRRALGEGREVAVYV